MLRLAKYLKSFKKEVIIGPVFKLLEAIFELIVPLVMARIIDIGIKNSDHTYIIQMGGIMIALGLAGLCFAVICQYSAAKASQGFGTIVRNELYAHINTLSHGEIDAIGTTSLITRLTNDVNQMQLAVAMLIRLVVRAPFLVIGACAMAMILDLKLSIIFLIIAPLVALTLYLVMSKSIPFYQVVQKKLDRISLITRENLTGTRVIRAFSKQEKEEERFRQASDDLADTAVTVGKISALLNPATFTIMNIAILGIIWFGGIRVDRGALTQGQIIAFVNYMTQISLALVVVANLVVIFTKASASAARINEIFDTKASIVEKEDKKENMQGKTKEPIISLKKVSFRYPNSEEYALEDISFEIEKGETIGIIGGTGSGKTTLIQLFPRFYDVSCGELFIEGMNVKDYSFEQLRNKFGIVPQKAVLFYGTIEENICWGKEKVSTEEIKEALEIAQASEFVEKLPEKENSLILQGAKNISGGQKQRLTIARALVRNPEILILDDSSSALDYATDAKLRLALEKKRKNTTTIIVSQRSNSVKYADKIIVLDDGKIVGIGTHQMLYDSCEIYREICLSQLSEEEATK